MCFVENDADTSRALAVAGTHSATSMDTNGQHLYGPLYHANTLIWPFLSSQYIRIKILRPLFNTNLPPKPPKRHLRNQNRTSKSDFWPFYQFCIFLSHFPISTDHFFQMQNKSWRSAQIKKLSTQTSFRIKFPIQFQRAGSLFQLLIFHRALANM